MDRLEGRRLLAMSAIYLGQDGVDLVGPDASVGPDGVQDLHVHLSGLAGSVGSIAVRGPSGFDWAYGANAAGSANAEFFPTSDGQGGDLYLNPTVRSDLGGGGATGAPGTLAKGSVLNLTVVYQGGSAVTDAASVTVAGLAATPLTMPATAAPANVVSGDFAVTSLGQDGTSAPGDVHLRVTGLAGRTIASATLSDGAGSSWSMGDTSGRRGLRVAEASGLQSADLDFAPTRDESAAGMILRLTFAADPLGAGTQHVASFAGGAWQPALVAAPLNGKSVGGVATQAALASALATTGAGEVDTIALKPGATIVLTGPLRVTHSVKVVGNGATLDFTQGPAPWSASATGAIYAANPSGTDIAIDLEGFAIRFGLTAPLRWYASAGSSALFDPESAAYGVRAVINTSTGNAATNREVLTLKGMTIGGPPAFDAAPPTPPDAAHTFAGEPEIPLVEAGNDNGTIAGNTFQGGSVALAGGPWSVTGNVHTGALAGTYTPSAFSFTNPHDVALTSNTVYQSAPGGTTFRLANLAESGYADTIAGNAFLGGQVGDEVTYVKTSATSGYYSGINDSEVILAEPKVFLFEGAPAAVSADGRVLVLPMASASVASRAYADDATGPGLIVSIVSAGSPSAGTWYRVAQRVASSPMTFLMQDPLPTGNYVISVVAGFVGDTIANNVLNLSATSSTGIVLSGGDFGTTVSGNVIEGGSRYAYPYTGGGILVASGAVMNAESPPGAPFPIPIGWSHYPDLGISVTNNVIFNSLGNLIVEVLHGPGIGADAGRLYLGATVSGNLFAWQQPFLAAWASAFAAIPNGNGNAANLPGDASLPPTVTIGSGFSANGGTRLPWTAAGNSQGFVDPAELNVTVSGNTAYLVPTSGASTRLAEPTGQVYAGTVDGASYTTYRFNTSATSPAGDASPYAPFNGRNLAVDQARVDLNGAFTGGGIGVDGAALAADLDAHGNSYSATALGASIAWAGASFALGAGNTNNVISATGQTIGLPAGSFSTLAILGASVFGPQSGVFLVTYTDGTSAVVTLTFSDWVNGSAGPGTTAPGESIAAATPYTNNAGGTYAQSAFVYGETLPIAQGKAVKSITLPSNSRIKILAMDLI